jgi:hypothetical protein
LKKRQRVREMRKNYLNALICFNKLIQRIQTGDSRLTVRTNT